MHAIFAAETEAGLRPQVALVGHLRGRIATEKGAELRHSLPASEMDGYNCKKNRQSANARTDPSASPPIKFNVTELSLNSPSGMRQN